MALVFMTNSYLEDADAFLSGNPDWEAADLETQEQALIDATSLLDQKPWGGTAVSASQPLAWYRASASFFDPTLNLSVPVQDDEVPVRVQKATANLALHLIRYPEVITDPYGQTFNSIKVGPIALENGQTGSRAPKPAKIPLQVMNLIEPLLDNGHSRLGWWRAN